MERSFYMRDMRSAYVATIAVAVLMVVASTAGLLFGARGLYGSESKFFGAFIGQDVLNLLVGLPLLVGAVLLASRGSLTGALLWPGALFYVLYDYGYYVLGAPVNALFFVYLALASVSAFTMIGLLASIDGDAVRDALAGRVPVRTTAVFLIALACLFTALWTMLFVTTLANGTPVDIVVRTVWTMDLVIQLPALFIGGVLLWRRRPLGYVAATGLLVQAGAYLLGLSAICLIGTSPTGNAVTTMDWLPGLVVGGPALALAAIFVRPAVHRRGTVTVRNALLALLIFNGLTMLQGAIFVVPTLPQEWIIWGPFSDYVVPAIALGLVGTLSLLAAALVVALPSLGARVAIAAGIGTVLFEVVEVAVVGIALIEFPDQVASWLQPFFIAVGAFVIALGLALYRESRHARHPIQTTRVGVRAV